MFLAWGLGSLRGPVALLQRSWRLQLLLLGPRSAPASLQDAATAASGAPQRSSNVPGRCNCFWGHATLQQRFWTLQMVQMRPRDDQGC